MGWSDFHLNLFAVFVFSIRWFWPITIISIWVGYWWHDKYWISSGSCEHFAERGPVFLKIMDLKLKVPFYISIALCFSESWGCGSSTSGGISQRVTFQ
jgi:hypothetical protein